MSLKDLPDHIFWEKCEEDNLQAFDVTYFRYFKRIYSLAKSSLKDEESAKELALGVMLRLAT